MPGTVDVDPTSPKWNVTLRELLRREPAGDVRADRVERHVAQVEQAGVADDDVQADRHHHVHADDDHVKTVGTNWATVLLAPTAFTRSCW